MGNVLCVMSCLITDYPSPITNYGDLDLSALSLPTAGRCRQAGDRQERVQGNIGGYVKMATEGIKLIRDFREKRDAIASRLDDLRGHL